MYEISIIISYYSGINILKMCLKLLEDTISDDVEVIVVNDNDKTDIKLLENYIPNLVIYQLEKNSGYSVACNYGAKKANGKYIIFMDCDIMVTKGWLENLKYAYTHSENCGAVSSTILNMNNGYVTHWGMETYNNLDIIKPFRDGKLPDLFQKGIYEFKLLTSGCLFLEKTVFNKTKGFLPILYNGYCDLDLIMQIRQMNYRCYVTSESKVYHRGKVAGTARIASEQDTKIIFMDLWREQLREDSKHGLNLLKTIYQASKKEFQHKNYIIINFSKSLLASEYHDALSDAISISILETYNFRNLSLYDTILEDNLSWSLLIQNTPFIYFCDNILPIKNNTHWFMKRKGKGDIIADRNGNILVSDSLLKN